MTKYLCKVRETIPSFLLIKNKINKKGKHHIVCNDAHWVDYTMPLFVKKKKKFYASMPLHCLIILFYFFNLIGALL